MKSFLAPALIITFLLGTGYLVSRLASPPADTSPVAPPENIVEYFITELVKGGIVSLGGQPREGFDPDLLLRAYPGLKKEDFDQVKSAQGKYYFKDGTLEYVRDQVSGIHSAEKALETDGMRRLLQNLSKRLGIKISSNGSIDLIIGTISR
jgi:hypothetical protein